MISLPGGGGDLTDDESSPPPRHYSSQMPPDPLFYYKVHSFPPILLSIPIKRILVFDPQASFCFSSTAPLTSLSVRAPCFTDPRLRRASARTIVAYPGVFFFPLKSSYSYLLFDFSVLSLFSVACYPIKAPCELIPHFTVVLQGES